MFTLGEPTDRIKIIKAIKMHVLYDNQCGKVSIRQLFPLLNNIERGIVFDCYRGRVNELAKQHSSFLLFLYRNGDIGFRSICILVFQGIQLMDCNILLQCFIVADDEKLEFAECLAVRSRDIFSMENGLELIKVLFEYVGKNGLHPIKAIMLEELSRIDYSQFWHNIDFMAALSRILYPLDRAELQRMFEHTYQQNSDTKYLHALLMMKRTSGFFWCHFRGLNKDGQIELFKGIPDNIPLLQLNQLYERSSENVIWR